MSAGKSCAASINGNKALGIDKWELTELALFKENSLWLLSPCSIDSTTTSFSLLLLILLLLPLFGIFSTALLSSCFCKLFAAILSFKSDSDIPSSSGRLATRFSHCKIIKVGSQLGERLAEKSNTKTDSCWVVFNTKCTTWSVTDKVWFRIWFSRFSIAHATSLTLIAPTIRPEPFSKWKPRRTSIKDVRSCVSASHMDKKSSTSPITSSASSIKVSRRSSSCKKQSANCCRGAFNGAISPLSS